MCLLAVLVVGVVLSVITVRGEESVDGVLAEVEWTRDIQCGLDIWNRDCSYTLWRAGDTLFRYAGIITLVVATEEMLMPSII